MKRLLKYLGQKIEDVFIWSSGANKDILSAVPTEKNKYFGIGGTIIFTALMASFAGGYAFFTAFKSVYLSVPFGIFWGMLIFNLDRYIVASFGVGDGEKTISKQELIEAAPRLAMAIVLGFVISTPLELKLFEKEINAEIATKISIEQKKIVSDANNDGEIVNKDIQIIKLQNDIKERDSILTMKQTIWNQSEQDMNDEWNFGKFSGKQGKGGYYDSYKKKAEAAQSDYLKTKTSFDKLDSLDYERLKILSSSKEQRELKLVTEVENKKTVQAQNDGLLARLTALSSLTSKEWSLSFAKWLITCLFIFIEIAPILFKMMTERGPYDDIVDRIKHETKVRQLELQSNINQEINTSVRLHTEKHEHKLNAELQSNKEILEAIAKAQQELAFVAIEKWKEEQKVKLLNSDMHDIVTSQNGNL
jgi:hypothetical protein